jgi:ribonuclease P protein component
VGVQPPGRRTFGRVDRLRSSREFQHVSRRGRRATSGSFVVIVAPRAGATGDERARFGLTVSRRVGGAVVRNRVKRRLREWFRHSAARAVAGLDWVVIARPAAAGLESAPLRDELDALCRRALAGAKA